MRGGDSGQNGGAAERRKPHPLSQAVLGLILVYPLRELVPPSVRVFIDAVIT